LLKSIKLKYKDIIYYHRIQNYGTDYCSFPFFLHLLLLHEHLDLQEHFKNPCPPDKDWLEAASRTLMVVSQLISSCNIKSCLQMLISFAPNVPWSCPKRVPTTALPLLLTLKKKDIRKCESKVLKTFSYFFFVDALNTKQIISTLFRVRRNRRWFCLVSLVSLKIKPFNQFSVLLWNYLIFENVVSDHEIQIKLNICNLFKLVENKMKICSP
jgi:hypothetical protein